MIKKLYYLFLVFFFKFFFFSINSLNKKYSPPTTLPFAFEMCLYTSLHIPNETLSETYTTIKNTLLVPLEQQNVRNS